MRGIILQDWEYYLLPVTKDLFVGVTLPETIDLFSLCDVLRNELTTYLDHMNKHVMKDGVMINAQAYHDTSLSNLLLTEKCSTGLSVNYKLN